MSVDFESLVGKMKRPDLDAVLGKVYDETREMRTSGRRGYSLGLEKRTTPRHTNIASDVANIYERHCLDTNVHTRKRNPVTQKSDPNGVYYHVGAPRFDKHYFKIYVSFKGNQSNEFFEKFLEHVGNSKNSGLNLSLKFSDESDHNSFLAYVPAEHFENVAGFLSKNARRFHKVEANHTFGFQLCNGVSVVVANEHRGTSVDGALREIILDSFARNSTSRDKFIEHAKQAMAKNEVLGKHFELIKPNTD